MSRTSLNIVSVCRRADGAYDICVEEGNLFRRIITIPSDAEKQQRVLDAARTWQKQFVRPFPEGGASRELADAVDALDAPVERYTVTEWPVSATPWNVVDGGRTVACCHLKFDAEKIAAALNAAERAK